MYIQFQVVYRGGLLGHPPLYMTTVNKNLWRKDGTTDRGHFIGPFPSVLGGPIKILAYNSYYNSNLDPFLYKGFNFAILHASGNVDFSIERLKSSVIDFAKTLAPSLRNLLPPRLSIPTALFVNCKFHIEWAVWQRAQSSYGGQTIAQSCVSSATQLTTQIPSHGLGRPGEQVKDTFLKSAEQWIWTHDLCMRNKMCDSCADWWFIR